MTLILIPILLFMNAILYSWACVTLYEWFIYSRFTTVELTYPIAYGICLLLNITCKSHIATSDKPTSEGITNFVVNYLRPIIAVGLGYITKTYFI